MMNKRSIFLASLGLMNAAIAGAQETPAEKVGNSPGSYTITGQIPNTSPIDSEYFSGAISIGQSTTNYMLAGGGGAKASLNWYEFTSDGVTPITFDMYGTETNNGSGFGAATNAAQLAVYNSSGGFIASNKYASAPANGDSNVPPVIPAGVSNPPVSYFQPMDPTQPVYTHTPGGWVITNYQALPNLNFVNNPQSNPLWNPSNANYNPYANWNQYPILPAGTYFLAVSGYHTVYSGNPGDAAAIDSDPGDSGGYTSTSPFGFIDYSSFGGPIQLNARVTGDFNGDGVADLADLRLLRLQVAQYLPTQGISGYGFADGVDDGSAWVGLPSSTSNPVYDLAQYDLTGNSRIDAGDISAWGRYTGNSTIVSLTWNNTATANDPQNPGGPGDGVTWDVETSQNFNDTIGTDVFFNGDLVTFNDNNNGNYTVTLNSNVAPGSLTVNNSAGNYVISGTGTISGTTSLLKTGTSKLTLSTLNTYTGGTNVSGGTLALTVTGALPVNSALTIGTGATVIAVNHGIGPKVVLQTSSLSIAGSTNGWTGLLDLGNNDLIAAAGSLSQMTNQIKSGYKGNWQGSTGITSSAAATDSTHLTALGVIQNSTTGSPSATALYTTFDGLAVSNADVLVKYTYYGDANLDGKVDGSDYTRIDNGYLNHLTGWFNGDFNYDGVVDGSDYTLIDNAFNTQGTAITSITAAPTAQFAPASIPEPAALSLVFLTGLATLRRRRTLLS